MPRLGATPACDALPFTVMLAIAMLRLASDSLSALRRETTNHCELISASPLINTVITP